MTSVFLSYARDDDEPFVKRLYEDLRARDFEVWWDRVSMPSRALTFLQEIRDAIDACDRLVLVVGPRAVASDYVGAEWRYALEVGKAINPVLRLGEYDLLPEELALLDAPDFRCDPVYESSLEKLVRQISEPVAPMGRLIGVPILPPHFLRRPVILTVSHGNLAASRRAAYQIERDLTSHLHSRKQSGQPRNYHLPAGGTDHSSFRSFALGHSLRDLGGLVRHANLPVIHSQGPRIASQGCHRRPFTDAAHGSVYGA